MRCKVGDLAVIVKSWAGNEGKIVRCISPAMIHWFGDVDPRPSWIIDRELPDEFGELEAVVLDEQLRPIRDQPGTDETLTSKPVERQTA